MTFNIFTEMANLKARLQIDHFEEKITKIVCRVNFGIFHENLVFHPDYFILSLSMTHS